MGALYIATVEPVYSGHLQFLEKVSAITSVRYIEVFNISQRKGKKDTLMHNNVLNLINTVTGKRVNRGQDLDWKNQWIIL